MLLGLRLEGWAGVYLLSRGEGTSRQMALLWSFNGQDERVWGLFLVQSGIG